MKDPMYPAPLLRASQRRAIFRRNVFLGGVPYDQDRANNHCDIDFKFYCGALDERLEYVCNGNLNIHKAFVAQLGT